MSYLDNAYGMRDLQQMLLDMMLELDRICRKHRQGYSRHQAKHHAKAQHQREKPVCVAYFSHSFSSLEKYLQRTSPHRLSK